MMKSRIHRPGTCRPKTQMATQRCCLSELRADSRCSLSIVDDEIKDTSTWHVSSKNTNGYTKMLPFRTTCRLKMFTVNSWWWNQGYIDLARVVQKHKWLHKDAAFQNCLSELRADSRCSLSIVDDEIKDTSTWHVSSKNTKGYTKMLPFRTTCRLKMFIVNSWWWNQGYIDLAPVVQKHKWRYASCQNYVQTQDVHCQ